MMKKINRKERWMTVKNKIFVRNLTIISLLCILTVTSLVSLTVSWFKNSIDAIGPTINTGKIDVSLTEYHFDGTQWASIDKYSSPVDSSEEYTRINTVGSFAMDLSGEKSQDDVFYVIEKNEGSIPVDVSLGFVVDGYDSAASVLDTDFEVIGGFWYRLENVTEEYREASTYFSTGENNPINKDNGDLYKQLYLLNSDVRTSRLDSVDVAVFRLTCGYVNSSSAIPNRYNRSYDININFCVSQLGGLDGSAGGDIHYVSTEDELRNKLNEYKPGDGIFLESDITFYGDFIIDRPLKLYVQGHTLDIEGNLTVSYSDRGSFLINTQRGGRISVKKVGTSGSMIVDIPNAKLELVGSGNSQIGKGDIYIENKYYVSASYEDGLIVSSSFVRDLDFDEGLKDMTIGDSTKISVSANTYVGKLIADNNTSMIRINNYGNIEAVDFRNVVYRELTAHLITDQSINNVPIQSRLENAGIVDKVYLNKNSLPGMTVHGQLMRYNEYKFIDEESGKYHGNTRLINRLGGQISAVESSAEVFYLSDPTQSIKYIIEVDINITYVEKVTDENGNVVSPLEFIIRYTNRYGADGTPNYDTTLADVLEWYEDEDISEAYKFTVICYGGKYLTEEDYKTLNNYTSLVKLDLSGASSQDGITPTEAFSSLNRLEYLLLPSDSVLSANAFEGTALDEVTLQSTYTTIEPNAFLAKNGNLLIKYLHLMQSGAEYDNLNPAKQFIFVVDDVTLTTLRAKYSSYQYRFFLDAERRGDYFIRIINDDLCELAVYVGDSFVYNNESKSLVQNTGRYSSFDFNEFSYREDGEIITYKINSFDDYAFYNMIKDTNNSLEIHFKNAREIGDYAFYNCTGIVGKLTFSGTVNVGSHAFEKCTNLERVLGVDASNSKIGSYAFAECKKIYEVYAPGFTHVGEYSFKNCTGIYAVRMPHLYSMGKEAFLQSKNLHYLETSLIITGEGWDGVHGSSITAVYTNQCNAYDIKSFLNYVVNFDTFPANVEIPSSLPNVLQYGANGNFYNWSHFIKIIVPTGYESYVGHISSLGTYVHTKTSVNYTGAAKYLKKLDDASGACERWDAPYRFEETDSSVQYVPADFLYEEVAGGARLIACFDDLIVGDYYIPDVIKDGDRTVKVTEMDTRVFFTTHLGSFQGDTYTSCSIYFGENIRLIEDKAFLKEPNKGNGHDNVHVTRRINIIDFGGLQTLTPCIVGNGTAYNRDSNAVEIFAPNVTVITENALKGSTSGIYLDDIHFPKLKTLEAKALYQNTIITGVNNSCLETIGESAFYSCTALKSFVAPNALSIGATAFYSCTGFVSVEFPKVITVGKDAFSKCTGLVSANLPSVLAIESAVFVGCTKLQEISMESVETVGDSAFANLTVLTTVNIPKVTSLGKDVFLKCTALESIDLPSIITINNSSFSGCTKLREISAESATTIGESVFASLSALTAVNIPKVTSLGKNAFQSCTSLESIDLPSIITIANAAFSGCSKLKEISAESATTLNDSVFASLSALTTVNLPKVTSLGKNAFQNCTSLESIDLPSIITIANASFPGCSKLKKITANSVTTVGASAFSSLSALTTVEMPNVVSLGASCFQNCYALTAFSSEKLVEMGEGCFYSCTSLSTVYVPNVSELPKNAFRATSVVNVSIPEATSIGESAFEGVITLKTLNAPKVTYIGKNALYNCSLWWINLPSLISGTSNSSWNGGFKGAVYGDLGDYIAKTFVKVFRVLNGEIQILSYKAADTFSTAYDVDDVVVFDSKGNVITYENLWRAWTNEEEETPFRIYVKGEADNTLTLAFLNGFYSDEVVDDRYVLHTSTTIDAQEYKLTALLYGVASKFDFDGKSLEIPVNVKEIPEYFAYKNTTLCGVSAAGVDGIINQYAFYGCTSLVSAIFPNAITLQQHTFEGCSSLRELNFNALQRIEGGQNNGAGVGGHFKDCTSLVSVSLPSLTYIQDYISGNYSNYGIFEGCTSLASVSFGSEFNQVLKARNMFKNATSLVMVAFDGCPTIDSSHNWYLSGSASIFVSYANYDVFVAQNATYSAITQFYEIVYTESETGISYYLKELSSNEYEITLIEIPADFALNQVVLLSIYDGKNIVSMNSSAWKGLENQQIQFVVLPDNLRFFNKDAIANSIESFEISSDNSSFLTVDGVLYSKDGSILIAYPKAKLGDAFTLPAAVTMISSNAFSGTANLITLTINHKVTIGDCAFYDCAKLQNVIFTATEASSFIGEQTFVDCDLQNTITVWVPSGTVSSYKNAVIEDIALYSKFSEGTP